ncbi:hypothetical protein ACFZB9_16710 [Kitasatospora sp. NPDC008050]|uniref:hypothetical protein n=1 Tax=Kitasatospora sp. NPDC008050 TaxID=3364021 RepID=UPI0036E0F957
MHKALMGKTMAIVATIPMLMLAASGSAFADSEITWTNVKTGGCLTVNMDSNTVQTNIPDVNSAWSCSHLNTDNHWWDSQDNLNAPNGAYAEHPDSNRSQCLTSYWPDSTGVGAVYLEQCSSPINWYEQWYENRNSDGTWQLKNRETGACLDSGNDVSGNGLGAVYAMACGSDYQKWK